MGRGIKGEGLHGVGIRWGRGVIALELAIWAGSPSSCGEVGDDGVDADDERGSGAKRGDDAGDGGGARRERIW